MASALRQLINTQSHELVRFIAKKQKIKQLNWTAFRLLSRTTCYLELGPINIMITGRFEKILPSVAPLSQSVAKWGIENLLTKPIGVVTLGKKTMSIITLNILG